MKKLIFVITLALSISSPLLLDNALSKKEDHPKLEVQTPKGLVLQIINSAIVGNNAVEVVEPITHPISLNDYVRSGHVLYGSEDKLYSDDGIEFILCADGKYVTLGECELFAIPSKGRSSSTVVNSNSSNNNGFVNNSFSIDEYKEAVIKSNNKLYLKLMKADYIRIKVALLENPSEELRESLIRTEKEIKRLREEQ